jgi:hypothetical protein
MFFTVGRLARGLLIPRGFAALGFALQFPTEDRYLLTRSELLDRLAVLLGGRAAEAPAYGDVSTGAQDELQRAADIAHRMVKEYRAQTRRPPDRAGWPCAVKSSGARAVQWRGFVRRLRGSGAEEGKGTRGPVGGGMGMTRRKLLGSASGGLVLAVAGKLRWAVAQRTVQLGEPAPELSAGAWVNGGPLPMARLRGRVVLIDFWTAG